MFERTVADGEVVSPLLEPLADALVQLLAHDFGSLSDAELLQFTLHHEQLRRSSAAVDHLVLAEINARRLAGENGYRDTASLLAHQLRLAPGEARARVRAAEELGPRRSFTGEQLEPEFAEVAAAERDGTISATHARMITSTLAALPPEADVAHAAALQPQLVAFAQQLAPKELGIATQRLLAYLDPDGQEPQDELVQRARSFTLHSRHDNSSDLTGRLTPDLTALVRTMLDSLAAPAPADDGVEDPRTPAQRRHDALQDALTRLLRDGALPSAGGVPATVIVTMTEEQFRTQQGYATTTHGDLISVPLALQLADQAELIGLVFNFEGGIVSYGRTRRCASASQRLALAARDGGCSFPGCSMPSAWTEAHHVIPWRFQGETELHNLCLLCGFHHRNFEKMGWRVYIDDGVPWWVPPPHIDPVQRPVRNAAHGSGALRDATPDATSTHSPPARPVSGGTVSGGTVSGGTVSGGTVSGGTVSGGAGSGGAVSGGAVSTHACSTAPSRSGPRTSLARIHRAKTAVDRVTARVLP